MSGNDQRSTRFWDAYAVTYDAIWFSIPYREHLAALVDALSLRPGVRVLDIGCGTGNLERMLVARAPQDVRVVGVDHSEAMLRRARRKLAASEFVCADLRERLPFDDASFDRVVVNNVLYVLEDKARLVEEILRVLVPGGVLVLSDPKAGARVSVLVAEHFEMLKRMPPARRLRETARTLLTLPLMGLAPMLLSALVIGGRVRRGDYRFSSRDELEALVSRFSTVTLSSVYAGQSWMAVAVKPGAERVA